MVSWGELSDRASGPGASCPVRRVLRQASCPGEQRSGVDLSGGREVRDSCRLNLSHLSKNENIKEKIKQFTISGNKDKQGQRNHGSVWHWYGQNLGVDDWRNT